MNSPIVFVVTGADHTPHIQPIIKRERYIEYMLSLHKIFSYHYPVVGVISEINRDNTTDRPPFEQFPFTTLKTLYQGELDTYNKSTREFISIVSLLSDLPPITDETFIIKISGRYMILNDTFITTVQHNIGKKEIVAFIRTNEQRTAQYTFLYAMRYRYFKQFYEQSIQMFDTGESIEHILFHYLKNNNLLQYTIQMNELGILANINNSGIFEIY
jgi:hypothetical protein